MEVNRNAEKYLFLSEYAKIKYEHEVHREESIIRQSSYMQTVFSFITAALFMVASIVIKESIHLSTVFFIIVFSSITCCLLLSLFSATMAQNRKKKTAFLDISDMTAYMIDNEELFEKEEQRQKYLVDTFANVQKSKAEVNDENIKWIKKSMMFFYFSLVLCVFWFVVAICKII